MNLYSIINILFDSHIKLQVKEGNTDNIFNYHVGVRCSVKNRSYMHFVESENPCEDFEEYCKLCARVFTMPKYENKRRVIIGEYVKTNTLKSQFHETTVVSLL